MQDAAQIRLSEAKMTNFAGSSLAFTLYTPCSILLTGELGAGKTTFLQGFLKEMGVSGHVTSPSYALEQRYKMENGKWKMENESELEILHIDLYRLNPEQSEDLISSSDDHKGIRCIEWADRLPSFPEDNFIHIQIEEERMNSCNSPHVNRRFKSPVNNSETESEFIPSECDENEKQNTESTNQRVLTIQFNDIQLPTLDQIDQWRKDVRLPSHIIAHCNAVADFCDQLATQMLERGVIVRPLALRRAAEVHDLFRFVDFREGASHQPFNDSEETKTIWQEWSERYAGLRHEPACAAFLRDQGFPELAEIVSVHGLRLPPEDRTSIEQKLLFYADKRVMVDQVVTLDERFEDFHARYGDGEEFEKCKVWLEEAKRLERELFP